MCQKLFSNACHVPALPRTVLLWNISTFSANSIVETRSWPQISKYGLFVQVHDIPTQCSHTLFSIENKMIVRHCSYIEWSSICIECLNSQCEMWLFIYFTIVGTSHQHYMFKSFQLRQGISFQSFKVFMFRTCAYLLLIILMEVMVKKGNFKKIRRHKLVWNLLFLSLWNLVA